MKVYTQLSGLTSTILGYYDLEPLVLKELGINSNITDINAIHRNSNITDIKTSSIEKSYIVNHNPGESNMPLLILVDKLCDKANNFAKLVTGRNTKYAKCQILLCYGLIINRHNAYKTSLLEIKMIKNSYGIANVLIFMGCGFIRFRNLEDHTNLVSIDFVEGQAFVVTYELLREWEYKFYITSGSKLAVLYCI